MIRLSVCPSCGTMVNDSVREELAAKISTRVIPEVKADKKSPKEKPARRKEKIKNKTPNRIKLKPSPKKIETKPKNTAEIEIKHTNRTLVEFQAQQTQTPEWRIQLQNVVRQRYKNSSTTSGISGMAVAVAPSKPASREHTKTVEPTVIDEAIPIEPDNELLAKALQRIELSRRKYLIEEPQITAPEVEETENDNRTSKEFPFTIACKTAEPEATTNPETNSENRATKPVLVAEKEKPEAKTKTFVATAVAPAKANTSYDTNELDPGFVEAKVSTSFDKSTAKPKVLETTPSPKTTDDTPDNVERVEENTTIENEANEEFEDFAPFSMRFNSGLFDFIIGSFITLFLLSPFMLLGGSWFSLGGVFGFLATFSIVMFIYMTTTIGLFGRTFGMHLFSLELIDIDGEEYPTFHQAAVSSSIFLLSTAFGGAGFLTVFADEDSRAIHDLVSGTIVVREP